MGGLVLPSSTTKDFPCRGNEFRRGNVENFVRPGSDGANVVIVVVAGKIFCVSDFFRMI